jgi:hypothetical protein
MTSTPELLILNSESLIENIILSKTPLILYSPKLKPENSFGIPSPFILSNIETISTSEESYPLSDNEIQNNYNLKKEKINENKKKSLSNQNVRKKLYYEENGESCFFPIKKNYEKENDKNEFIFETKENESDFSDLEDENIITNENEDYNEEENNLSILNILRKQKFKRDLM